MAYQIHMRNTDLVCRLLNVRFSKDVRICFLPFSSAKLSGDPVENQLFITNGFMFHKLKDRETKASFFCEIALKLT